MPQNMYNTGMVHSARSPVLFSTKVSFDAAAGTVTAINGKQIAFTSTAGSGVITATFPQTFTAIESIHAQVLDGSLSGAQLVLTQGETVVKGKTTLQFTLAKGATPAAITTGVFTIYLSVIGVNR